MRPVAYDPTAPAAEDAGEIGDAIYAALLDDDDYEDLPALDDRPTAAELADGDAEWAADDVLTSMRAARDAMAADAGDAPHDGFTATPTERARWYQGAADITRSKVGVALARAEAANDERVWHVGEAERLAARTADMEVERDLARWVDAADPATAQVIRALAHAGDHHGAASAIRLVHGVRRLRLGYSDGASVGVVVLVRGTAQRLAAAGDHAGAAVLDELLGTHAALLRAARAAFEGRRAS